MPYICKRCGRELKYEADLDRHNARKKRCNPSELEKYKCKLCNMQCLSSTEFKNHSIECMNNKLEEEKTTILISQMYDLIHDIKNLCMNISKITKNEVVSYNETYIDIVSAFELCEIECPEPEKMANIKKWISTQLLKFSDEELDTETRIGNKSGITNNTMAVINTFDTKITSLESYIYDNADKFLPNAKNLSDCLNIKNITPAMIDDCVDLCPEDIAAYMIGKLCWDKDVCIRPIHCTNKNKGNYMIKESQIWIIDNNGTELHRQLMPIVLYTYEKAYMIRKNNISVDDVHYNIINNIAYLTNMQSANIKKACTIGIVHESSKFLIKNNFVISEQPAVHTLSVRI